MSDPVKTGSTADKADRQQDQGSASGSKGRDAEAYQTGKSAITSRSDKGREATGRDRE